MAKYRKKPIVIDAVRIEEQTEIHTPEGVMIGEPGDWLITGIAGEKYPCKNDVFVATYTSECSGCPHLHRTEAAGSACTKSLIVGENRKISSKKIPDWCPLFNHIGGQLPRPKVGACERDLE